MKLVRRVPRTSPLHMDLQGFPWCCSIVVTCEEQKGQLSATRVVKDRENAEQRPRETNFKQIRLREHCEGILGDVGGENRCQACPGR